MQISLAQQVALVTGASSGLGAASARALAAAGAAVVLNYHSQAAPAQALADEINQSGGRAIALAGDVSKEADVEQLFAQTLDAFGYLDILVANSGLQKDAAVVDMTLEQWNTVIGVNLTGTVPLCTYCVADFQSPRHSPRRVLCGGQDHSHELGAPVDSLGRAR